MDEVKNKWKAYLLSAAITILASVTISQIIAKNSKLDNAASTEYVDSKDNKLQEEINRKVNKDDFDIVRQQINFIYQEALRDNNAKRNAEK